MEPIAIIGLSLKLPGGAEDESSLWELLESRKNASNPWPQSRANTQGFHQPGSTRKNMASSYNV
jgi:acyl transferase domain-containing protein